MLLCTFGLNLLDRLAQPLLDRFLEFDLVTLPFHGFDGLAVRVQRNVVTGHILFPQILRNQVMQQALAAGMWP